MRILSYNIVIIMPFLSESFWIFSLLINFFTVGDLTGEQLDEALEYLVQRVEEQQSKALALLQSVFSTFHHFSTDLKPTEASSKSDDIKEAIRTYFKTETLPEDIPHLQVQVCLSGYLSCMLLCI